MTKASTEVVPESPILLPLGNHRLKMALLKPAERNPRRGSVGKVVESLLEFGQHRPVVVQRTTSQVIVGNHLLKAAQTLGWEEIDAFVVDDDDQMALRRAVADNAVGDQAQWDREELADLMKEIGPVPGFDQPDIDKLLLDLEARGEVEEGAIFPITARFSEHYDYVVVVATNDIDSAWLQTKFDARTERSHKNKGVGRSRVITVERARELLDEL